MKERRGETSNGYDRLARYYGILEWLLFRHQLHEARIALVSRLSRGGRILLLGDGTGRLLRAILVADPAATIVSVDSSSVMLDHQRIAAEQVGAISRVQFVRNDIRQNEIPNGPFDVVVAAFFWDCFTFDELQCLMPRVVETLCPAGLFYFVDFLHPANGWRRLQSKFYHRIMHAFFRWQTGLPNRELVDLESVLNALPIKRIAEADTVHPMLVSRLYQRS